MGRVVPEVLCQSSPAPQSSHRPSNNQLHQEPGSAIALKEGLQAICSGGDVRSHEGRSASMEPASRRQ